MWTEAGWPDKRGYFAGCRRSGSRLYLAGMVDLTKENFDLEVLDETTAVLVDFWAPWCGPCQMAKPVLEELAKEYEGKVKFGKVNVDEAGELAGKYGVQSIPTVVLFVDGKEAERVVGFNGREGYEQLLKKTA